MKYLKTIGLAAIAAMALMAVVASSASATRLEVGGTPQEGKVAITASLTSGTSAILSRTDGSLANTCTTSALAGETEKNFTTTPTGAISSLSFENCERGVTVHKPGKLYVEHESGTNGNVFSEEAEVTVGSPFGTLNCKTGEGAKVGTLTGVTSGNATVHVGAVLNCGFLVPSASWKGTYTVTTPSGGSGLGVTT